MEDQIRQIVEIFKRHLGQPLYDVHTQHTELNFGPAEMDAVSTKYVRIVLDFQKEDGGFSSVFIRISIQDDEFVVQGFSDQPD